MSLKKACLIVKATNSRVGSLRLPTLFGWLLLNELEKSDVLFFRNRTEKPGRVCCANAICTCSITLAS